MGVVEHFEQGPHAPLDEAYRLLKPGGLAFVSVPTVNIIRRIIRRPIRNAVNTFLKSLIIVKKGWSNSKAKAAYKAIDNLVPEKVKTIISRLPGRKTRYCHFTEYRYTRSELENFLRQAGFEIIKTIPHDFYGSKNHAIGLCVDFPFLRDLKDEANFKLNPVGEFVSRILDGKSPWIACSSVICVARSLKKDNTN
jgi:ubiquinone/menaquinone biosynthesis C-methylase UbiE